MTGHAEEISAREKMTVMVRAQMITQPHIIAAGPPLNHPAEKASPERGPRCRVQGGSLPADREQGQAKTAPRVTR